MDDVGYRVGQRAWPGGPVRHHSIGELEAEILRLDGWLDYIMNHLHEAIEYQVEFAVENALYDLERARQGDPAPDDEDDE